MSKLLYACLFFGLLTACVPVHQEGNEKKYYEPLEKHVSGHLYRSGRHIHHHPECHRLKQEKNSSEQKDVEE